MSTFAQALPERGRPYLVLVIGIVAVSFASIFIRWGQEEDVSSLVLAGARLTVASAVLTPLVLTRARYREELRALRPTDLQWALVSGLVLGLHFATWISSLEYTAVVNSVTLVTTNPLWVALLAPFLLGEKLSRWAVVGLALALSGGILVSLNGTAGDPPTRSDPLLGNSLALIGAVMAALYFIIGRRLRARLSVVVYIWLVYSAAALILIGVVVVTGQQVGGLSSEAYLWMLLMGLIPQLIGHTAFNYALGFLPAAFVSLAVLGEPLGSGVLAIVLLKEWPTVLQLVGAAMILIGIAFSSRTQPAAETE
jgi:drug/metabolite transporter (DMT)-like permease